MAESLFERGDPKKYAGAANKPLIFCDVWSYSADQKIRVVSTLARPPGVMAAYFSSYHLWAAQSSSLMARYRESELAGKGPVFDIQHRAFVTSAVLAAVAFVETAVNELLKDAADYHDSGLDQSGLGVLDRQVLEQLRVLWQGAEGRGPRPSTLEKYREILRVAFGESRTQGPSRFADVDLLFELRNHLTHFTPANRTNGSLDDLERQLRARFDPSPLMAASENRFFPDKCLGSGCAGWATESAKAFVDDFFAQLESAPNYLRVDFGSDEPSALW